jgi:hypothetical protein
MKFPKDKPVVCMYDIWNNHKVNYGTESAFASYMDYVFEYEINEDNIKSIMKLKYGEYKKIGCKQINKINREIKRQAFLKSIPIVGKWVRD